MSEMIRQTTIVEQVMERMKNLIVSEKYKPGDKLPPETDLAHAWGVSRSSIREAVKVFNYLGLLDSHAGKGTFLNTRTKISGSALSLIALLGSNESNQIVDMRFSLELWCTLDLAECYAAKMPDAVSTVERMESLVQRMADADSSSELIQLDIAFHEEIIRSQHNDLFAEIFDTLRNFSYDLDSIVHSNFGDASEIVMIHRDLLSDIKSNNTNAILNAVKGHNTKTMEKYQVA